MLSRTIGSLQTRLESSVHRRSYAVARMDAAVRRRFQHQSQSSSQSFDFSLPMCQTKLDWNPGNQAHCEIVARRWRVRIRQLQSVPSRGCCEVEAQAVQSHLDRLFIFKRPRRSSFEASLSLPHRNIRRMLPILCFRSARCQQWQTAHRSMLWHPRVSAVKPPHQILYLAFQKLAPARLSTVEM